MSVSKILPPGSTIGILGSGQLGRMTAMAAARLGYRCIVYAPDAEGSIAAQVSAGHVQGAYDDTAALASAHASISPAYSLVATDFGKLRTILALLTPGLVFAINGAQFSRAIKEAVPSDVELVVLENAPQGRAATSLEALWNTKATAAVDAAHAKVLQLVDVQWHASQAHQHGAEDQRLVHARQCGRSVLR